MIIDYRGGLPPDDFEADLCIIGAGAAGLAIAREFLGSTLRVCVVESGGFVAEERTQALYDGSSIGMRAFDPGMSRLRAFGGTCNLWGGGCIPLGQLGPREWVPGGGWPITYSELEPFYARAREFCRIESHEFESDTFLSRPAYPPLQFDATTVVNKVFAFSPILFGDAYRDAFARAPNIQVLLHANVLELDASDGGGEVRCARIATLDGRQGRVRARQYVLACGGIENARLLLLSDSAVPQGLGNERGLVGRYFMDHPSAKLGELHLDDPQRLARPYDRNRDKAAVSSFPEICLSDAAQRDHRILNGRVRPFPIEGPVPKGIRALRAFKAALRPRDERALLQERLCSRSNGEPTVGRSAVAEANLAMLALRVGAGIGDITRGLVRRIARKPTVASDHVALVGYFEQAPNPDSRVLLGEGRDALGRRKVCVDWRLTALDIRSFRTSATLFGNELARVCKGRFTPAPWVDDVGAVPAVFGTSHHLGTTRMSEDPGTGVVDRHCRVHGVDNLYVAGSSVFPTGGWAFPTFTIVALSLRLAEHLRARLELASMVAPYVA